MPRFLVVMTIAVAVLAVAAVGLVVYKSTSHNSTLPVAATEQTADTHKPATVAVRTRSPQTAPTVATAAFDDAAVSADSVTAALTGSLDVDAFIKSLTPEEERALGRTLMDKFMQQRMQERRYQLPVSRKLNRLNRLDPKFALTEAQRAQLNNVTNNMKPTMDATFQSVWAQQDQLFSQMGQIFRTTTDPDQVRQQFDATRQQMDALNASVQPQRDALDQQALAAMTPYLTQDQIQALSTMAEPTGGGPDGGGPPDDGGPPGGFGPPPGGGPFGGGGPPGGGPADFRR